MHKSKRSTFLCLKQNVNFDLTLGFGSAEKFAFPEETKRKLYVFQQFASAFAVKYHIIEFGLQSETLC